MHLEDLLTTTNIRQSHHHLAIKTTRTQQSRIQHIRTVGGSNHNDCLMAFKAIHLNQHLVQRLLPLIVTTAKTCATLTPYCINFINEDDTGCRLLGLFKHVAHAGGTDTDKHLDKIGTRDREEGNLGFTGNGLGQQSLTCTRLANHENAFGDLAAQFLEAGWILEVVNQLFHLFFGLIATSHISKGGLDLIFTHQTGTALAK